MIIYDVSESGLESGSLQDVYCIFCGKRVGPDENSNFGDCEHLRLNCTNESWDHPETSKENFFKDFNEDEEFHFDYLDKKLDDNYLMVRSSMGGPSTLEAYFIFCQFPKDS